MHTDPQFSFGFKLCHARYLKNTSHHILDTANFRSDLPIIQIANCSIKCEVLESIESHPSYGYLYYLSFVVLQPLNGWNTADTALNTNLPINTSLFCKEKDWLIEFCSIPRVKIFYCGDHKRCKTLAFDAYGSLSGQPVVTRGFGFIQSFLKPRPI